MLITVKKLQELLNVFDDRLILDIPEIFLKFPKHEQSVDYYEPKIYDLSEVELRTHNNTIYKENKND